MRPVHGQLQKNPQSFRKKIMRINHVRNCDIYAGPWRRDLLVPTSCCLSAHWHPRTTSPGEHDDHVSRRRQYKRRIYGPARSARGGVVAATVRRRTCDHEISGRNCVPVTSLWASCAHPLASTPPVFATGSGVLHLYPIRARRRRRRRRRR